MKESIKVQLTMPSEIMERVDLDIERTYTTRSRWFVDAALKVLEKREREIEREKSHPRIIDLDI